ncbi:MAG: purine-nucleoside phosphorylase [Bryobacterales bacterium]|nr:purine-nucleoside phosphorylase [Bryobacterales bacterium]
MTPQLAADFLLSQTSLRPKHAVILGSGLGAFADSLTDALSIPYCDIPGWPQSTAIGHAGRLCLGTLNGLPLAVLSGRAHLYEGHSIDKAVFGIRALGRFGVKAVVVTNAAGGINLSYSQGGLVLISDHINMLGVNPLTGPNDEAIGPRFPDMTTAYDPQFRAIARDVAQELGIDLPEGVYLACPGPSYETPAEIRAFRTLGADLVGMSTVPEVIVARHMGLRCLAISCVTNMAAGILAQPINHEEVLETGARVRGTFLRLLSAVLPRLDVRTIQ